LELEDKKQIFLNILPEEDFVDRRINKSEFLDPESDSNEEDLEFVDGYDQEGKLVRRANSRSNSVRSKSKSGQKEKGMRSTSEMISPHSQGSANRSVGFKQFDYPHGDDIAD
jgi:protein phosphatase 1 regulatory subunit 7